MTVYKAENDRAVLRIEHDDCVESPRTSYDNLGTFLTWERNYLSPDNNSYGDPRDFLQGLAEDYYSGEAERLDEWTNAQLLTLIQKHVLILPVYRYEHGMIAYSTKSFAGRAHHADWDSCQSGWIYVTKAAIREEWNVRTIQPKLRDMIYRNLNGEVETYSSYANGDVYGFVLEKKNAICNDGECTGTCTCGSDDITIETEQVDSCWGFYGTDWENNGIAENIPDEYRELVGQL